MRKKKLGALLCLLLCGAMLAVPAAGTEPEAEPAAQAPLGPVLLEETVKRMVDGALLLT